MGALQNALSLSDECAGTFLQQMSFAGGLPQSYDDLFPTGTSVLSTHVQGVLRASEMALGPTWDLFLDHSQFIRNEFMLINQLVVPSKQKP